MDNFTAKTFSILADNLGHASYYVAKEMSKRLGYTVSEERASFLIARSLIRQYTIDTLCEICLHIENQDNDEFAHTVSEVFKND